MFKKIYALGLTFPKTVILITLVLTVFFAWQLPSLRWETDARVYLPKGHEAILYDEKVDDIFGVKDAIIIGIKNEEEGIFNAETLARIDRITKKVAALDGVLATRSVDVASLATSTVFVGTETDIGSKPLMEKVPQTDEEIAKLKKLVYDNADLFVGNIVSADGKAAMIRAKLKEGISNRYMTYFQIKGILDAESGKSAAGDWKQWQGSNSGNWNSGNWQKPAEKKEATQPASPQQAWPATQDQGWLGADIQDQGSATESPAEAGSAKGSVAKTAKTGPVKDTFYLAGRPVIEVSSGLFAMQDMKIMIPLVIGVMALVLLAIFRTLRGMILPLVVMSGAIVWTLGTMVLFDVPLYTISTMLPVILVAVGIGDAVHLLSEYYGIVLHDPHRDRKVIVKETMQRLGPPLITTTVTTAIGFLSLFFAEMPPFKVFGLFAVLGIIYSWFITITVLPAVLVLLQPKVAGYLAKKRALRLYSESSRLAWLLTRLGAFVNRNRAAVVVGLVAMTVISAYGSTKLFVDSSWLSDFKKGSEVTLSNDMLNDKFSGTIFLNVVIEAQEKDAFKDPVLLHKIEALQAHVERHPLVGDSLSIVDYMKNMNKNLHAGDEKYNVLPETQAQVGEYLFLFSVSGRPQQLDEVVDYDYRRGLVSFMIKTDHTRELKAIIDDTKAFVASEFAGTPVDVNLAGSANNSYIWADLLINSQTTAIIFSKLGILVISALIFFSLVAGLYVVVPVTLSTLLVAGIAGLLSIPLDVSTALAAGIAIGVGVDYAVHYLFRYVAEFKRCQDHDEATAATLRSTGKTIVLNAIVVTAGFAVLCMSQFPPHVKLGYFVTAYMIVSCIVALITLPVLTSFFQPGVSTEEEQIEGEATI